MFQRKVVEKIKKQILCSAAVAEWKERSRNRADCGKAIE